MLNAYEIISRFNIMNKLIVTLLVVLAPAILLAQQKEIRYDGSDLGAFVRSIPDNSRVVFDADTLVQETTLLIVNKKNIQFDFNGTVFISRTTGKNAESHVRNEKDWPRNRSHISIRNSEGVTITNLTLVGPHTNGGTSLEAYVGELEAQHAIEILNSRNVSVESSRLSNIYGDGVYIGKGSSNIQVMNCFISKNGRQGIGVSDGSNILITGNEFNQIRRAHIDLECNNPKNRIDSVVIKDNHFGSKRLKWIAAASGKGIVSNIYVENNTLDCPANIYLGNHKNPNFQGPYYFNNNVTSKAHGNPQGEIWKLRKIDGFFAENNQMIGQKSRTMYLIGASNSRNIQLHNNEVKNGIAKIKP